jgi:hypothetical protein
MSEKVLLAGNNVALLVAGLELAKKGRELCFVTDGRPLGAHFAGMQIDGYSFDIGMVLLEKVQRPDSTDDLRNYNPEIRNDWTRFGHLSSAWLDANVKTVRVPTSHTLVDNFAYPDYLLSNRLDAFRNAQGGPEGTSGVADPTHASHKVSGELYDTLTYEQAASFNHGQQLHAHFIEPFVRKLTAVSSSDFLARYHRAGWVPLYYPETIHAAIRGENHGLQEYPFWTTKSGSVAEFMAQLRTQLSAYRNVTIVDRKLGSLSQASGVATATTEDGEKFSGDRLAVGLPNDRCHTLLQQTPPVQTHAASVTVMFCVVDAAAIGRHTGCMMVVDETFASYRLTDQDTLAGTGAQLHRITIEAGHDLLARQYPEQAAEAALAAEVVRLLQVNDPHAVKALKCITASNALVLPDDAGIRSAQLTCKMIKEYLPGAALTGTILGYGVASLNDQLVQGLKVAKEFS